MGNNHNPWTEREDEVIRKFVGLKTHKSIAAILTKAGTPRSEVAVRCRANSDLGLMAHQADNRPDLISISGAAREVGCNNKRIAKYCADNKVPLVGRGKCQFLPIKILPAIKARYPQLPGTLSVKEVSDATGYHRAQIQVLIDKGILRASRCGSLWRILREDAAKLERTLRLNKQNRIHWAATREKLPEVCITTREASEAIECSQDHLLKHIKNGWIRSYRVGPIHMLALADLRDRFPNKVFHDPVRM